MTALAWREEPIARQHDRNAFDCGDPSLNEFLRRFARQSHEQDASKTFCAVDPGQPERIIGFYTVAPTAVAHASVQPQLVRGLARHEVAGFKLARLAVHKTLAGQGFGGQLLAAAARRCLKAASHVGGTLLVIDAKSERAASWYKCLGATSLQDLPLTLVMPLSTFATDVSA